MTASLSPADAISDPKALGTGLAVIPHTREATLIQLLAGLHSSPNRSSNGLAFEIGSGEAAPYPSGLKWHLPRWATGGHVVERVGSDVTASFIHLRSELAGDPAQNFTDRRPSVGLAFHGSNHEGIHAREVVKACQGLGNVCRA